MDSARANKVLKTTIDVSFELGELLTIHTLINSQLCEMKTVSSKDEYKSGLIKVSDKIQKLINI